MEGNIVLSYPVKIYTNKETLATVFFANRGCEVFMDEHLVQWVKFVPQNGSSVGKEHMMRTQDVLIVRDDK